MEIPRIQRTTTFLRTATRRKLSSSKYLYWTISKRKDLLDHEVSKKKKLISTTHFPCILTHLTLPPFDFRFVSFVAGAFTAVLALASLLDTDLVFKLEITPHRTAAFYLAIFGGILAAARSMIPEDNRVFDPELLMTEVITYTHYMPEEWKGQLHSKKVNEDF